MEEKIISYDEIVKKIKSQKKVANIVFYISTILIPVIIWLTFNINDFIYIAVIFGLFYAYSIYSYIYRNISFSRKIDELDKRRMEIDKYCVKIVRDYYATEERLMLISGNSEPYFSIKYDEIESVAAYMTETGGGEIEVKTKDGKTKKFINDKRLFEVLQHKRPPKMKLMESSLVKDFYISNDSAKGIIKVPGLNRECEISISDPDDHALEYAERAAKKVKEYSFNDFKDAIVCSLWAYQDYLKEYGYDEFMYNRNKIPIDVTENNILDYMSLGGVISSDKTISFLFDVPWEIEHGFSWVFRGKELVYVGSGLGDDSPSPLNYAKKYHKEVVLTSADQKRIEESYHRVVGKEK